MSLNYIDITKHNLGNKLTNIFNLPTIQKQANKFKSTQATVTTKPANKNLELVV